jgi:hypothetical protein
MTDLSQRTELYELELPYGLTVTMKRLTTAGIVAARRTVEVIEPGPHVSQRPRQA